MQKLLIFGSFFENVLYTMSMSAERASYRQIARELMVRIENRLLTPGEFLPTERELQIEFAASRTTIRRALAAVVDSGLCLNVPNRGIQVTNQTKLVNTTPTLAFIDGSTIVLKALFSRLSELARQQGFHLLHIDSEIIGLNNALEQALEHGCVGAFVWSFEGFPNAETLERIQRTLPIIQLDHRMRGIEGDLVSMDYFEMSREITAHLIAQGYRSIAITGMLDMLESTHDRLSGYMKAHFDAGINPLVKNYCFSHTSGRNLPDFRHLTYRMNEPDRPDAIFVMSDDLAPFAVEAVLECGSSIPQEIGIATIGVDTTVSLNNLGITAILCDWDCLATEALGVMQYRLNNPVAPFKHVLASHRLIEKGSCRESGFAATESSAGSFVIVHSPSSAFKQAVAARSGPQLGQLSK